MFDSPCESFAGCWQTILMDYKALYLRNLLTHTVNNLLQTLNNVKSIQLLLLKENSILFTSCVKISKPYLGYYANYSLFNLKGSKSEVTKNRI